MKTLKELRLEMAQEDIDTTLIFQEEYKAIKKRYQEAKTEEEMFPAIDDHDDLLDKEMEILRKWAGTLKKMKFEVVN